MRAGSTPQTHQALHQRHQEVRHWLHHLLRDDACSTRWPSMQEISGAMPGAALFSDDHGNYRPGICLFTTYPTEGMRRV